MKRTTKILLIILFLLLIGVGTAIGLFYSQTHKTDTDIPSVLTKKIINPITQLSQKKPSLPAIKHVFIIVEENHDWSAIHNNTNAPFINNILLKEGAYASNYHNVPTSLGELHPSELNYIFMESGTVTFSDHSFATDNDPSEKNSTSSLNHLVTLLEKNGFTWKSYQEGISGADCPIATNNLYAPKHNPSLFFQDVSGNPPQSDNAYCRDHIRPFSELQDDLSSGNLPNYVFITPNLNNDMHNGTVAQADTWLSSTIPLITSSSVYKKDGAIFITWDEGSENKETQDAVNNNAIGMIIVSPFVKKGYTNSTEYSHASLLKTVEELFHATPLLGLANDSGTKDLFDFFNTNK